MKNLLTILALGTSLALGACSADQTNTDTPSAKTEKTSAKGAGFYVKVTGLEASGKDCIASIKLTNKTGEKVRLFQFIKYTAIYDGGEASDHGSHYALDNGESTTRAGVMIAGASCKSVHEIRIDEMLCQFTRDPKTMLSPSCAPLVVLKGYKKVKLTIK